jgi:hypothetical protein
MTNFNVDDCNGDNAGQGFSEKRAYERAHEIAYRDGLASRIYVHGTNEYDDVIEPITDDAIDALCVEAGAAGDSEMVDICHRAADGDGAALYKIARAIADAAAMAD